MAEVAELCNNINIAAVNMTEMRKQLNKIENIPTRAREYENKILPMMENLRDNIDKLEMIVNKEMWPMPSYGDLLFEV